jgi:hypothetical protein
MFVRGRHHHPRSGALPRVCTVLTNVWHVPMGSWNCLRIDGTFRYRQHSPVDTQRMSCRHPPCLFSYNCSVSSSEVALFRGIGPETRNVCVALRFQSRRSDALLVGASSAAPLYFSVEVRVDRNGLSLLMYNWRTRNGNKYKPNPSLTP